jgi:hypothetical protein
MLSAGAVVAFICKLQAFMTCAYLRIREPFPFYVITVSNCYLIMT